MPLPASIRRSLYVFGGVAAVSGVAWLVMPRRFSALYMEIHAAAAMALLVLAGAASALHSASAWRQRRNRVSGTLVAASLAILAVTGYFLYYLGDERARSLASATHWVVGLACVAFLAVHAWLGRRSEPAAPPAQEDG